MNTSGPRHGPLLNSRSMSSIAVRIAVIISIVCMITAGLTITANQSAASDFIEIYTEQDLFNIRYNLYSNYILKNDITLSSGWTKIDGNYNGIFDGNYYTISNMNIDNIDGYNTGFFAAIGISGIVRNVYFDNANVNGYERTGIIAGTNNGTITNVQASGIVSGGISVASIAGYNWGKIANSSSNGSVTIVAGSNNFGGGGIVGSNFGKIYDCITQTDIVNYGSKFDGLCGGISARSNPPGDVRNCIAAGTITMEVGAAAGAILAVMDASTTLINNYYIGYDGLFGLQNVPTHAGFTKLIGNIYDWSKYAGLSPTIWHTNGQSIPYHTWTISVLDVPSTAIVGAEYAFQLSDTAKNARLLNCDIITIDSTWLNYDHTSGSIVGTPSIPGTETMMIMGDGRTYYEILIIIELPAEPSEDTAAPTTANGPYTYTPEPSGIWEILDGTENITVLINGGQSWLSYDADNKTFTGTPPASGTYEVLIYNDGTPVINWTIEATIQESPSYSIQDHPDLLIGAAGIGTVLLLIGAYFRRPLVLASSVIILLLAAMSWWFGFSEAAAGLDELIAYLTSLWESRGGA